MYTATSLGIKRKMLEEVASPDRAGATMTGEPPFLVAFYRGTYIWRVQNACVPDILVCAAR